MSNLRGTPDAKPVKLSPLESRHRLTRYGHLYGCSCGNVFMRAHTMSEADMYLRVHQQVVKGYESGDIHDNLADEDTSATRYPKGQGIWK
jgi:hypothetical protein